MIPIVVGMPPPLTTALVHDSSRRVRLVLGALMLALLLAALDQTIVATALPTIVGDLGSVSSLSWVVTAYLLASTVVLPLYGKLGDLYGRKAVLQTAIVIFLAGSALSGLSGNMTELIAFRAVQGLGGGGLLVVTIAAVGDVVPPRDRGRYQGYFGGVFGVATVVGPLLGGLFVDSLSWRWIFYVNLPIGIVTFAVIASVFRARTDRVAHRIDYLGAVLLGSGLAAVVLYTRLGGTSHPWGSAPMLTLLGAAVVLLAGFLWAETRAAEPLLPLGLFRNRVFSVTSAMGFIVGLGMFGAITFVPLYLQDAKGHSPTVSGLLMTPMMAGVLLASILSGNLISRFGSYGPFPIVGTALMAVGLLLLSGLQVDTSPWSAAGRMVVLGLGLGSVMQVLILAAQNAVDAGHLGVVTSGSVLFRQVGGSIGVSVFGAVFARSLASNLAGDLPPGTAAPTATDPAAIGHLPASVREVYATALTASIRPIFLIAAVLVIVAFAHAWVLPERPLRATAPGDGAGR